MNFAILCMAVLTQQPDAPVNAAEFHRLLQAETSRVKDLSLIYEGKQEWIGPERVLGQDPLTFGHTFQGTYLLRSGDGAELTDVYVKGLTGGAVVTRVKKSLLKGQFSQAKAITDLASEEIISHPGGTGLLSGPQSPHPLIYLWLFQKITDIDRWGYEFRGWEEIGDRRCLVVKLNWSPNETPWHHVFWMDMERGAHPLRVDDYDEKGLMARTDRVALERFDTPGGGSVWLPVECVLEGFRWGDTIHDEAVMRATLSVVRGSVSVNRGLSDALFKVRESTDPAVAKRLALRADDLPLRKDFLRLAANVATPDRGERARVDLPSVEKSLDASLRDADE
jgi:hypothetical protein